MSKISLLIFAVILQIAASDVSASPNPVERVNSLPRCDNNIVDTTPQGKINDVISKGKGTRLLNISMSFNRFFTAKGWECENVTETEKQLQIQNYVVVGCRRYEKPDDQYETLMNATYTFAPDNHLLLSFLFGKKCAYQIPFSDE